MSEAGDDDGGADGADQAADGPTDATLFTREAADRIRAAVRKVERWATDVTGDPRRNYGRGDGLLWASIDSSTAISGGGTGGYKYAWTEEGRTEFGMSTIAGGRSGTIADGYALRLAEMNGIDPGPLPAGWHVLIRMSGRDDGPQGFTILDGERGLDLVGTVSAYTPGANAVTLTPSGGGADVVVAITLPAAQVKASIVSVNVGDVLAYRKTGATYYLASVPLPISTTRYDVLAVQGTSGLSGWDSVRHK
jgi:hypothetical protein